MKTQSTDTAVTMQQALGTVKELEKEGYLVHKIIIDNGGRSVIMLFKNALCEKMIETGRAYYRYLGHRSPVQGIFLYQGCRVVWPESFY